MAQFDFGGLPFLTRALVLMLIPLTHTAGAQQTSSEAKVPPSTGINVIPDSRNQIIKLTDSGVFPQELHMMQDDVIVFFLNSSTDSLATLQIDYGNKTTHCASANMKIEKDGSIRSVRPFGHDDFATVCMHDKGTYPVTVYGLKSKPQGIKASVIVE